MYRMFLLRPFVPALMIGLLVGLPADPGVALAQQNATDFGCAGAEEYAALDFWLGEWEVHVEGAETENGEKSRQLVGHNHIEKFLEGCAVREVWTDAQGNEGRSLFYIAPGGGWKQVWITEQARRPGGTKEKAWVESSALSETGAVRFQGKVPHPQGGHYFDRTTLTPLEGGEVRQVIEVSRDGETWRVVFNAVYVPKG